MIERKSGYDPETGICWRFHNKGEGWFEWERYHKKSCPVCSAPYDERQSAMFGRCRSGRRWFWTVTEYLRKPDEWTHGWEDTEELATAAAIDAVYRIKNQPLMGVCFRQVIASHLLKEINEAKRRQRPASGAKDAHVIEYLYSHGGCYSDGWPCRCEELTGVERILYHTYKFQILKTTKKRVYYNRSVLPFLDEEGDLAGRGIARDGTGYVDRLKLEADGEVYNRGQHWSAQDSHLYRSIDHLLGGWPKEALQPKPNLFALKAEMAAAHPDHGGSNAAFIAARARYVEARRGMARHARQRRAAAQ